MKLISWLTGLLTLTVAIFSFVVSFVSLVGISREFGFPIPYLFPLTIEAGVIIFSLNAIYRSLNKEVSKWQWSLVILSSLLALVFNVLHAQDNWISRVMFAIPSIFFLLSFENFLSQISYVTRKNMTKEKDLSKIDEVLILKGKELNEIKSEITKARKELEAERKQLEEVIKSREEIKPDRSKSILSAISESRFSAIELADQFSVTPQTIYNDVKKLEQEKIIEKNGKGWEVKK